MRYSSHYIVPNNPFLFDDLCTASLLHIFAKFFADINSVYEFGCGTGRYLFRLSEIYPDKKIIGLDWARRAVEILKLMQSSGKQIEGYRFNMLEPLSEFESVKGAAFYTVGSMEQLGSRFEPFLDFILKSKPKIVVHHEPVSELYDQNNLVDYVGYLYHRHRGYLWGYLTKLRELEDQHLVKIHFAKKLGYGDRFNDGSSLIIWEPL
jgi:SAM-dependent methyltransferase